MITQASHCVTYSYHLAASLVGCFHPEPFPILSKSGETKKDKYRPFMKAHKSYRTLILGSQGQLMNHIVPWKKEREPVSSGHKAKIPPRSLAQDDKPWIISHLNSSRGQFVRFLGSKHSPKMIGATHWAFGISLWSNPGPQFLKKKKTCKAIEDRILLKKYTKKHILIHWSNV